MSRRFALIMAGGHGTRFWPELTSKKPKQYSNLTGSDSLLTQTIDRFGQSIPEEQRYIITVEQQKELALFHSKNKINKNGIILEPAGRNTAPCILLALSSLVAQGANDKDIVAIVPSDHVILNHSGFQSVIDKACLQAEKESCIVTIGINPTFPHTGYGYIAKGEKRESFYRVDSFREKPDIETATEYLRSGNFLWNAGMFVSSIGFLRREFEHFVPEMYQYFDQLVQAYGNEDKISAIYEKLPKESIDYAIMEKSKNVQVIPSEFDWNDLGSWDALESVIEKIDENIIVSASHVVAQEDSTGNIVFAPDKLVALVGVKDLVVVSNDNAVLVLPKSQAQDVKKVVKQLQKESWGNKFL